MFDNSRPVLEIPKTLLEKVMNVLSILFLITMYTFLVVSWNEIPDRVPAHFNALGEVDRWGGKGNVLILPIVGTIVFLSTYFLSKFPHVFNYPVEITEENAERMYINSRKMITTLNLFMTFFFAFGTWETVQVGLGEDGLGIWFLPGLLLSTFGTIGYYMYRIYKLRNPKN